MSVQSATWAYNVFLSFRGEDTRKSFTSALYDALNRKGIFVFRDDIELKRGKSIQSELFRAIEQSRFSIIIFSKNYACSTWCLDELVKIVECNQPSNQQMIFPIFYDVEPTIVRIQTGAFQEAFANHEEAFGENNEKVQKWRDALEKVADLSTWELNDRNELEFVENIVKEISRKLIPKVFETHKELVGINSRLNKLMPLLDIRSNDACMIGIWGMGGVGKTTIARIMYDLISWQFEGSSFLEISENNNLISLQNNLLHDLNIQETNNSIYNADKNIEMIQTRLRHKRVLIVIDNVVEVEQLKKLAGECNWFGSGSRIIITSRDEHLLTTHGVEEDLLYKLEELNDDEARKLFCMKAFKVHDKNFEHLTESFVKYAGGLPLALRVLGSFLFVRTIEQWESALQSFKRDSAPVEIHKILQISFDGLEKKCQDIFLDIACFLQGEDKDHAIKILKGCDFDPIDRVDVLRKKSLISTHDNKLWMHDLLQEMGKRIVMSESTQPGKRSRLWEEDGIRRALSEDRGTDAVQAIRLKSVVPEFGEKLELPGVKYLKVFEELGHFIMNLARHMNLRNSLATMDLSPTVFSKMTKLRILKIHYMNFPEGLEYLPNELRFLEWTGYPFKFLPPNFNPSKIVEFHMRRSSIEQLWIGANDLNNLISIKLGNSSNLVRTPDFSGIPNLEELEFESCTKLHEIDPSLFGHKNLIELNLKRCTSLDSLPSSINMGSLRKLALSGCSKLTNFPEIGGDMKLLSELLLDGTDISALPLSLQLLPGLVLLNLADCKKLESLPSAIINGLKHLETLILSGCSKLRIFPEIEGRMEFLSKLHLDGTAIEELPSSVELLSKLAFLDLNDCKNLVRLPSTINGLRSLKTLKLSGCSKLENVPKNLGKVKSLEELDISGTAIREPD
ncbi:Resistance gene-like [Melia azedarach]|uniref:Resistance gene-like n=1 Tax=Melia azedarach TaxID=155640 RepID=A0ACC1XR15_MELAZ|nr:Resistance gene-like [Melia azedarach]